MPAQSMSVRLVDDFEIPNGTYEIKASGNGVAIGTIQEINASINVEKHTVKVFKATYQETVQEQITVYDSLEDDYLSYNQYQTEREFIIFYDSSADMLFSSAPSSITRKFLKHLQKNTPQDGSVNPSLPKVTNVRGIDFDFQIVANLLLTTKLVRFDSTDANVNVKSFSGDNVANNDEAHDAISNDDATQLIGGVRIGTTDYTVSISKPGTLVVYNKINSPSPQTPYPLLEFTLQALLELKII